MKKQKLTLKQLRVQSFVTQPGQQNGKTIKGGTAMVDFKESTANHTKSADQVCICRDTGVASCFHQCGTVEYLLCGANVAVPLNNAV